MKTAMQEDAKFLKKHIKSVNLDVHPTEKALIVKYHLEATILGEHGDPMIGQRKACQKIIRIKDIDESTEIGILGREVIDRCKLIPSSRLAEVEQLIYYLQNRRPPKESASSERSSQEVLTFSDPSVDFGELVADSQQRASINKLDDYIEMLYEDVVEKTQGTTLVLQLARNPDNLETMLQNETLIGALARVLKEDWRKSFDLATNIAYIFFCFSTFSQFQLMISHFKIGALCMQVIEYELKRYDLWNDDLKLRQQSDFRNMEKNKLKFQTLCKKQEQLLRVCFYLLLNLAEDVKTELKMVNRGVVTMLSRCLERNGNLNLHILVLTFLKKLSIFVENKNRMAQIQVVEKIASLFPFGTDELLSIALELLFNLSFDSNLRSKMVLSGLLDQIVPLLDKPHLSCTAVKLLYHLSMDDKTKVMLIYTDCIPLTMRILLESNSVREENEVKALLINLALEKRNAQLLAQDDGQGVRLLFERAFEYKDSLLLKLLRNIASHEGPTKNMFIDFTGDLAETTCLKCDDISHPSFEFGLDCIGILSYLTIPELDWALLLKETGLLAWIHSKLNADIPDVLLLEVVVLCGSAASDNQGAKSLQDAGVVQQLLALIGAKQEDDELVLQIVYVFYHMSVHDDVREVLVVETQVPAYLIDLMHDKTPEIRKMCDSTLQMIADHDDVCANKIQDERFRWHNAQWLEMIGERQMSFDGANKQFVLDDSDDDSFNDLCDLQAEDLLNSYDESDRPES